MNLPETDFVIRTERIELLAGTGDMVRAEKDDREALAGYLNAHIPSEWPPDLNDLNMKELSIAWFEAHPAGQGWLNWYFVAVDTSPRTLIGIGGFSDMPDKDGTVEIGYSILPRFQRRGYATEAARGLCGWAFRHPEVRRIVGEIHPGHEGSARVLQKCGFLPASGSGIIATYELLREPPAGLQEGEARPAGGA